MSVRWGAWGALFACVSSVSSMDNQDCRVLVNFIQALLLNCQAGYIALVGDGRHPNFKREGQTVL